MIAVWEVFGIKTLTIRLDDDLHKAFKIYALEHNTDMQAFLIAKIKEALAEERKSKPDKN